MGMREYPDATYKVDESVIKKIAGYNELMKKLSDLNIDFGDYAQYIQYGDTDYLREQILDNTEETEDEESIEDKADEEIEKLDKIFSKMQQDFKTKNKGFGIAIRWINSDCSGDVHESFFELTGYVKPKANSLASWVGWSEWA